MTESMASEPAEPTTRQDPVESMPFDLWWSPSLRRFLARHESQDDEHLVWVFHGHHEALRRYLGTGPDSNPPMPDDAVRLVLADPAQTTELEDRAELADQLASANECIEEQDARISQLEAEVVKQRIIAKNATDHWRQSSILASLRAANAQRGLELRKLNLAMARKNRVIAKRESERDVALWLHAEAAWRVAGFDVLTVALARRNHQLTAERDERQTRIDRALAELDKVDRDVEALRGPVNSKRLGALRELQSTLRAALVGDQPTAEEPYRCPTLCDDDCESPCHEAHAIPRKRQHDVADCEARQPLSGEALRNAEERDDAAGDLP